MKHILSNCKTIALIGAISSTFFVYQADAQQRIKVEVSNNSPQGGVVLTPVWAGFHDGSFDTFEVGSAASAGLESIAEDGAVGTLSAEFNAVAGRVDMNTEGGIAIASPTGPGPIQPGETESRYFDLATDGSNDFFSFASMVLISNDYFAGNNDGIDISSVLAGGGPVTVQVGVPGERRLYDAGTEENDFATSAANGAPFFGLGGGQTGPDQGADENGSVLTLSALGDPFADFANPDLLGPGGVPANFNFNDTSLYSSGIATITISAAAIPEPGSLSALMALGTCGLLRRRR
jgi:hypothetical protein